MRYFLSLFAGALLVTSCFVGMASALTYDILAFGDSITQGKKIDSDGVSSGILNPPNGARTTDGYEPELENDFATQSSDTAHVYNWGYGGEITYQGVNRIDSVLDSRQADFILIMEGANDLGWGVSASTVKANLRIMIEKSLAKNTEPIIATVTPNTARSNGYIIPNSFNPAIKALALEKNIALADQYAALVGNWSNYHSGDGLHFNDAGERILAQTWFDAIMNGDCPAFVAGPDACTSSCPCGEGQGDCDSDADCEDGLTCVQNVGAQYGWPASRDVCEAGCPDFVAGPDACTSSCPCGEGQGDCDSDADCEDGLTCVQNVGARYGWPASRDVCEAGCPAFVAGPDACTGSCPCGEGQGDCDSNADCEDGLICVPNVGAQYGWPESRDVCESPTTASCALDSRFSTGAANVSEYLYTDRTYTITGGVPDWMVGRTLIQTPNDERNNNSASGYIRFTTPVSYWVYVLFDSRSSSVPNWLSGWELRSQYQMRTSLGTQPYLKFYRKWFDAGDCVDLGGNRGPGASNETRSNYVVVYGN